MRFRRRNSSSGRGIAGTTTTTTTVSSSSSSSSSSWLLCTDILLLIMLVMVMMMVRPCEINAFVMMTSSSSTSLQEGIVGQRQQQQQQQQQRSMKKLHPRRRALFGQRQQQQRRRGRLGPVVAATTTTTTTSMAKNGDSDDDKNHNDNHRGNNIADSYSAITSSSFEKYKIEHKRSVLEMEDYWEEKALELLDWDIDFDTVVHGSLKTGDVSWFHGGKLNAAYNAIDRHVLYNDESATRIALLWEGDEPNDIRKITYRQLLADVSRISNALLAEGVTKGDVVTIYMPMIPELPMTMLACTRIGAIHSVVFAGFSSEALSQRIMASKSKYVITADVGVRGSKRIPLKNIVNDARDKYTECENIIEKVFVWERFYKQNQQQQQTKDDDEDQDNASIPPPSYEMQPKDIRMDPLVAKQRPYCSPVSMDSEDTMFILYTSGSTGQPKGLVHTVGGYSVYATLTTKVTFDLNPATDIYACVADCGWITGHTYVVYGPLMNGVTSFLFESTPLYPNAGRYWDMIDRHQITKFYTAPTAIRSLMRYGDNIPKKFDLSSLQILGSVGEPINPEAWRWYYDIIGRQKCTIVDTYWQTESGGHLITNIPSITPMIPGSCTLPFYGIDPVVLDPITGKILYSTIQDDDDIDDEAAGGGTGTGTDSNDDVIEGVLAIRRPWPGMARTCLGDHERYMNTYFTQYPGYYFTGDSVMISKKKYGNDVVGYHFITGRVDDVINVSGHRIGTAEVESALVLHNAVSQAAVVGKPHPIKGQSITGFVMLDVNYYSDTNSNDDDDDDVDDTELIKELRNLVRVEIGPFASPDMLIITPSLPMTRSGKIMRRILRKIVTGEIDTLGDTSTLADPSVVQTLIDKVYNNDNNTNMELQTSTTKQEQKQPAVTTTTTTAA